MAKSHQQKATDSDVRLMPGMVSALQEDVGFQEKCQEPFPNMSTQLGDDRECLSKLYTVLLYQRWSCARGLNVAEITDNGKEDERELVQTLSGAQE